MLRGGAPRTLKDLRRFRKLTGGRRSIAIGPKNRDGEGAPMLSMRPLPVVPLAPIPGKSPIHSPRNSETHR